MWPSERLRFPEEWSSVSAERAFSTATARSRVCAARFTVPVDTQKKTKTGCKYSPRNSHYLAIVEAPSRRQRHQVINEVGFCDDRAAFHEPQFTSTLQWRSAAADSRPRPEAPNQTWQLPRAARREPPPPPPGRRVRAKMPDLHKKFEVLARCHGLSWNVFRRGG